MKQVIIGVLAIATLSATIGCKQFGTKASDSSDSYKKLYTMARANGDYGVMANAIYNVLLNDSTDKGWQDSLVQNMVSRGLYEQAHIIAAKRIIKEPNNKILLEVEGLNAQTTNNIDEALHIYRKLYSQHAGPADTYYLVNALFAAQKMDSGNLILETVLTDPKSESETVEMDGYDGSRQKVRVKAAALNLKGIVAYKSGETKTAEAYLNEALKVDPSFVLVQQELQSIQRGPAGSTAQQAR